MGEAVQRHHNHQEKADDQQDSGHDDEHHGQGGHPGRKMKHKGTSVKPVSYTHLDVYKRQGVAYTTGSVTRPVGLILLAMFVAYIVCNVLAMKNTCLLYTSRCV